MAWVDGAIRLVSRRRESEARRMRRPITLLLWLLLQHGCDDDGGSASGPPMQACAIPAQTPGQHRTPRCRRGMQARATPRLPHLPHETAAASTRGRPMTTTPASPTASLPRSSSPAFRRSNARSSPETRRPPARSLDASRARPSSWPRGRKSWMRFCKPSRSAKRSSPAHYVECANRRQ